MKGQPHGVAPTPIDFALAGCYPVVVTSYFPDTIVAQATPVGEGAIGIIRLSGPKSREILEKIFVGNTKPADFESHRMYLGYLFSPLPGGERVRERVATGSPSPLSPPIEGRGEITHIPTTGKIIDQVMAVWMQAPHSFTGEEMVEIHAHGGPFILCEIIRLITDQGARLAEPGEFSKRAYLNGKVDLSQAEAIADLISAKNEWAAKNALLQLGGALSETIRRLKKKLVDLLAEVEAGFDFSEEDIAFFTKEKGLQLLCEVESEIKTLIDSFETGQIYKEGLRVALIGKPNVGKSSLLNALLREERAITHEEPGTTRDVVSGERKINGLVCHFFDTAGIHEATHPVEKEGIKRSEKTAESSDVVCFLLDSSQELTKEDQALLQQITSKRSIIIYSKSDLPPKWEFPRVSLRATNGSEAIQMGPRDANEIATSSLDRLRTPRDDSRGIPRNDRVVVKVSSKTGLGINELLDKIYEMTVGARSPRPADAACFDHNYVLNNVRHKECLKQVLVKLSDVIDNVGARRAVLLLPEECLAEELRIIIKDLAQITGEIDNEIVLDEIFSKFCIGK